MAKSLAIRDRIVELRRVRAGDLEPHRLNPRLHSDNQKRAVSVLLREIGYADALIAYKTSEGSLRLIDGHLRQGLTPDVEVPVLVTDLNEQEAAIMLAAGDPLAAMASRDDGMMAELLAKTDTDLLAELLDGGGDELATLLGREEIPDVQFPEYDGNSFDGIGEEATEVKFKVRLGDVPVIEQQVERLCDLIGSQDKGRALMLMVNLAAAAEDTAFVS